jgi:hypothetical protein
MDSLFFVEGTGKITSRLFGRDADDRYRSCTSMA